MRQDPTSFFHQYAHDFEAIYAGDASLWRKSLNRWLRRSMFLRYRRSLELCRPAAGKRILDVGCGPGHYAVALANMGASVIGVDSAEAMIKKASERAQQAGVASHCHFICQLFEDFATQEPFDHAICMGFLEYLPNPEDAIHRIMGLVTGSAMFSLPASGGLLALQRRIRYRWKTPLYMYSDPETRALFSQSAAGAEFTIERLHRDLFVVARPQGSGGDIPTHEGS
jgi:SAM-dependent methyltransferase